MLQFQRVPAIFAMLQHHTYLSVCLNVCLSTFQLFDLVASYLTCIPATYLGQVEYQGHSDLNLDILFQSDRFALDPGTVS